MKKEKKAISLESDINILAYAAKKNYKIVRLNFIFKIASVVALALISGIVYVELITPDNQNNSKEKSVQVAMGNTISNEFLMSLNFSDSEFDAKAEAIENSIESVQNESFFDTLYDLN